MTVSNLLMTNLLVSRTTEHRGGSDLCYLSSLKRFYFIPTTTGFFLLYLRSIGLEVFTSDPLNLTPYPNSF